NMQTILAVISALTMLVGNFIALVQKDVKRMLAYSSVAHAGYLLMGIVANNPEGWNAIGFYALAYLFMQFGAFTILSLGEKEDNKFNTIEDYYGFSKKHPFLAGTMSVFMLSLAGIPPFAGFFGKYFLFLSAIKAGYLWLTIIAVISSIISMYYYIGLILAMYFKEQKEGIEPRFGLPFVAVLFCLFATILFGLIPQYVIDFTYLLLG
ncbi:MAG: NADH-quinone oxidoreductase subunit N, partial [Candidatus Kapaibacteriota bacterium]